MKYKKPELLSFSTQTDIGLCESGNTAGGAAVGQWCGVGDGGGEPPAACTDGNLNSENWSNYCIGGSLANDTCTAGGIDGCGGGAEVGWTNPCRNGGGA
ncbi:MAG: hypothetical protein HQ564_09660 [Candidatus Saganbacteria bacterium]|nr:hypothetical protein [Candidatus Saganbacteria bacterium]